MLDLNYNSEARGYKFEQIRDEIIRNIENGSIERYSWLPTIIEVCEQYNLSRVTVSRAYMHLKNKGYITYITGKGYYVIEEHRQKLKILLVLNKLSYYKKMIYYGMLDALNDKGKIDLQIHHYDSKILEEIIEENLGKYDYYVIMPHFSYDTDPRKYLETIRKIPVRELLLLDKNLPELTESYKAVYQDFETDIYDALESVADLWIKYQRLIIIIPTYSNHPPEVIEGARRFCQRCNKEFRVIENADQAILIPGSVFIVIEEDELAVLIKNIRNSSLELGKDMGLISFNETVFKELLDITVFSTDFSGMGRTAGLMLLNGKSAQVKNAFQVIRRTSL
jgi:DNA-binding transcriptional regulator YhcF (GntR family)